jgi:ubiquinone/menaquinone biosynthesis C-methylase UbiE
MSAEDLKFRENIFDTVLMIEVLEHIPDDMKALKEAYRVLKPGGKLIITAPNKLFPFETHGFRIGQRAYGTKGLGFPVLPFLPEQLRRNIANARVYTFIILRKCY